MALLQQHVEGVVLGAVVRLIKHNQTVVLPQETALRQQVPVVIYRDNNSGSTVIICRDNNSESTVVIHRDNNIGSMVRPEFYVFSFLIEIPFFGGGGFCAKTW